MTGDVLIVDGPTISLMRFTLLEQAERDAESLAGNLSTLREQPEPQNDDDRRRLAARIEDVESSYHLLGEAMTALAQVGLTTPGADTTQD